MAAKACQAVSESWKQPQIAQHAVVYPHMLQAVSKASVCYQQTLMSLCVSTTACYRLLRRRVKGDCDAGFTSIRAASTLCIIRCNSSPVQSKAKSTLVQFMAKFIPVQPLAKFLTNTGNVEQYQSWAVTGGALQLMSDDDEDDEEDAGVVGLEGQEESEEEDVSAGSSSDTGSDGSDEFGEHMHASGSM